MEALVTFIGSFFLIPPVMIAVGAIGSRLALVYLRNLVEEEKKTRIHEELLMVLINGFLLFLFVSFFATDSPLIILIGMPLIIILDLVVFSRDRLFTYFYLFQKFLLNILCFFWLVVALAGLFPANNIMTGSVEYRVTILAFTLLICAGWLAIITASRSYPFGEFRIMLHDRKMGSLFFAYLFSSNVIMITSTVILTPILEQRIDNIDFNNMVHRELFIKTLLILVCSYVILFIQAVEIRQHNMNREMSNSLEKERSFRKNIQNKGMLHFFINVSQDRVEEGNEFLRPSFGSGAPSYETVIARFAELCVHPDNQEELKNKNQRDFFEELLESNSAFNQQIRVSPQALRSFFRIPVQINRLLKAYDKKWMWVRIDYIITRDAQTGDIYVYLVVYDVDSQVMTQEELKISATTDVLTGIYNRAAMESAIRRHLSKEDSAGAFILLDIDNFKSVNDIFGHPEGDEVLKSVAKNLKDIFRANDIIGRIGGDEFCVFVCGRVTKDVVMNRAKEINQRCRHTYYQENKEPVSVSVSIGIALYLNGSTDYDTLYKQADIALYQTKQKGKDSYSFYSGE